jgi:hypothetical protein
MEREMLAYKACRGCPLKNERNEYNCLLQWWKLTHDESPNVWKLASKLLAIPATSVPPERVFSAAANVVNKKRCRLKSETVDVLMFLRGNKEFV